MLGIGLGRMLQSIWSAEIRECAGVDVTAKPLLQDSCEAARGMKLRLTNCSAVADMLPWVLSELQLPLFLPSGG